MNRLSIKKLFQKKEEPFYTVINDNEKSNDVEMESSSTNYHTTIGRMSAFFAHEIRNPLTSIIGFSQYLEQDHLIKSNPNIAHYISIIKEEATRMELLIQELLSLSKANLDHDNLSIIDIKHSIEKIVTIYSLTSTEKNIRFNTDLEDEVYITGNTDRFERLIINLINNAIEAIEQDGTIDIVMLVENKSVILSIIDSGPGLPPELFEQIFFPFYTTKDEGTGIGLPICKTIIETLNGSLSIQNHPNKGLHVKMKIPLSQHISNKS